MVEVSLHVYCFIVFIQFSYSKHERLYMVSNESGHNINFVVALTVNDVFIISGHIRELEDGKHCLFYLSGSTG